MKDKYISIISIVLMLNGCSSESNDGSNQIETASEEFDKAAAARRQDNRHIAGHWDISVEHENGELDERSLFIPETDIDFLIFDYQADGFGNGENCHFRTSAYFFREEDGTYSAENGRTVNITRLDEESLQYSIVAEDNNGDYIVIATQTYKMVDQGDSYKNYFLCSY